MGTRNLDAFFAPRSVAIAGATTRAGSLGAQVVANVLESFKGQIFGINPKKVMTIFGEHGNIGPASVPIVLSKLREMGRLKKGSRIALLGIGSGLNCSMAEVVW